MPRGYYLGQGLIPLGYSSSDDDEGPCELPDGRIVCGPHGLVYCGKCCTDYSDMNDLLDEEDEEEEGEEEEDPEDDQDILPALGSGTEMVKGTGKVFPAKFVPSNGNKAPLDEFPNRHRHIEIIR